MPNPLVKIVDQSRGFRFWSSKEIYDPDDDTPVATARYVPNVDDAIWDWSTGLYRVTHVDYTNGKSTWLSHNFQNNNTGVVAEDIMLGSGPGAISESYRLYINSSVVPYQMAFDTRLRIYGSAAHHVKVFRGVDISDATGHVISARFNVNNIMISENILLESVVSPDVPTAVKTPGQGSVIETLDDGDIVSAVIYSNAGAVLSVCRMVVKNTDFIRTSDASKKYVIGVDLVSPFLSATVNNKLEVPLNLPVDSISIQGRVRYNDGSELLLPIDDSRFELHGLDNYVASVVGQQVPLVLTYHLANNEFAYGVGGVLPDRFLTELYSLETTAVDGIYSVKLFVVPVWNAAQNKWVLRYYLYNMDRNIVLNATPHVELGATSAAFDGQAIGTAQEITVAVNVNQVSPSFNYFRHVQTFIITMHAAGNNASAGTYYTVEYTTGDVLGAGLKAVGSASLTPGQWRLDVSNGYATLNDWLGALYEPAEALFLPPGEIQPPAPTHFTLRVGSSYFVEVPVTSFATVIDGITVEPIQGQPARLEFFRQVGVDKLQLATVGLTIKR